MKSTKPKSPSPDEVKRIARAIAKMLCQWQTPQSQLTL